MTENELLELVRDAARVYGFRYFHVHDSRRSPSGWPDVVLVRGKRLLFVELKKETGRLSPAQMEWQDLLLAAGQDHRVIRPSNVDALLAEMRRP